MKSTPLKSLLISSLNCRLIQLEKSSLTEMKEMKDFTLKIKSMRTMMKDVKTKATALILALSTPRVNTQKAKPKPKPMTNNNSNRTLKHDKSQMKLIRRENKFDVKTKPDLKRIRPHTVKKKPITKKDAEFEEIVRMHMIDFNRIEDDFSELKENTTIQNDDTLNINISLIDNDIDYFTNDFDKAEEEVINNMSTIKYPKKNQYKYK